MIHEIAKEKREEFFRRHPIGLDDTKAPDFYEKIIAQFNFETINPNRKIAFVLVAHLLHTLPLFVEAISTLGVVAAIIPKQSSCVPAVVESIHVLYADVLRRNITKELLRTVDDQTTECLQTIFTNNPPFVGYQYIILDHGGYFASQMAILKNFNNIAGIVEHTWNGEIKYRGGIESQPLPTRVVSIARTDLKALEDDEVAKSIVTSIQAPVLSGDGRNQIISRLYTAIVGFGHLGRAIALHLKNISSEMKIHIIDMRPEALNEARNCGFNNVSSDINHSPLSELELIIVATSGQVMTGNIFSQLRNLATVVCVTSSDDLFAPDALLGFPQKRINEFVTEYTLENGNVISLAANGGSVNFLIGSTAHPILHAILSAVYVSAGRLIDAQQTIISSQNNTAHPILHAVLAAVYVSICRLIDIQQTAASSQNNIQSISYDDQRKIQKIYESVYGWLDLSYKITMENLLPVLRDYVMENLLVLRDYVVPPVMWDMSIGIASAATSVASVFIIEKILDRLSADASKASAAAITHILALPIAVMVMVKFINESDWMNALGSMVMWSTAGVVAVLDIPAMCDAVKRINELPTEYRAIFILGLCGAAAIPIIMKAVGNKAVLTTSVAAVIAVANILRVSIGTYTNLVYGCDSTFKGRGFGRAHHIACHGAGQLAIAGLAAPILDHFGANPPKIALCTGIFIIFNHPSVIDQLPKIPVSVLRPIAIVCISAVFLYGLYRMAKTRRGVSLLEGVGVLFAGIIASIFMNFSVNGNVIPGPIMPIVLNNLCYTVFSTHYKIFKRIADFVENDNSVAKLTSLSIIAASIVGVIYVAHQLSILFATIVAFPFGIVGISAIMNAMIRLTQSVQTVSTPEAPAIVSGDRSGRDDPSMFHDREMIALSNANGRPGFFGAAAAAAHSSDATNSQSHRVSLA